MNVTSIEVFPRRHRQTASGSALVARYNADGTADETVFHTSALTVAQAVAIQPVGSQSDIVVAGLATGSEFAMLRYLSNGSLDPSFVDTVSPFSGDSFTPERIAVQADGEIVVAGYVASADGTDLGIARYLANGSLDTGFGVGGGVTAGLTVATTDPCGLAIGSDGSIVATCTVQTGTSNYAFGVVRLASDGTLDTSFNQSGEVTDDWGDSCNHATSVAIESDGSILVGGYDASVSGDYVDLVRFLPDGSVDPNFLYGQLAYEPLAGVAYSLAIQPNNMILVGGAFAEAVGERMDFGLARLMDSGAVDQNFGAGGVSAQNLGSGSQSAVTAVAVRPDGEILAAGVVGDLPTGAPTAAAVDLYFGGEADGAIVRVDDNAPNDLPLSGDATVPANTPYTLTLGDGMAYLGSGSNVSYVVNWGDGNLDPPISADDLAAQDDQVTHTYATAATNPITVDLDVAGDLNSPYLVGSESQPVTVDFSDVTTTSLDSITSPVGFGSLVALTATVTPTVSATGTPGGTVEFYDGTIDLGPGTLALNGSYDQATLNTPPLTFGTHSFTAIYGDDGTFDPSTSAPVSVAVNYPTFAGTLTISGTATTDEGYTLSLPQHDNTNGQQITNWIIDWGDGVVTSASGDQQAHQYGNGTQEGYMITAVATTSSDGDFQAALGPLSVSDDAPGPVTLTASASNYSSTDTMMLTGTFANNSPQESLNVSINWGDDSPTTTFSLDPGATSFQYPAQQYARTGTYGIIATVTDADGHSSPNPSNPLTVNYSNSPPADLSLNLDQSTISADDAVVNLSGSFTDLQTNIAHTVTIVWEDGAVSPDATTLSLDAGETTFQAGPYTYATIGSYTILVTVAGDDGSTTATTAVTPVLPEVMIGADIPVASESGAGSFGEFLVTRTDTSSGNLTVNYKISGTAERGTDYQIAGSSGTAVTGSVTIPAGQNSAVIDITPYDREIVGGSQTVLLSLSSGSGYNVASVYSTAMVTISDDYGAPSGTGAVSDSMMFFNPGGSSVEGSSGQAFVGDFIPMGVSISGDTAGKTFFLNYDATQVTVCTNRDGSGVIHPGTTPITPTTSYTVYYVFGANGNGGAQEDTETGQGGGTEQDGDATQSSDISVDVSAGCSSASLPCSLNAALSPLQLYRTGLSYGTGGEVNVTDGSTDPNRGTATRVNVGEKINLSVSPAPLISLVSWDVGGQRIHSYIANTYIGAVVPFFYNPLSSSVSYAWVDGGSETVTATVLDPFGTDSAQATFNVKKPNAYPTAVLEHAANTLGGTGYLTAAQGVDGINAFQRVVGPNPDFQTPPWLYAPVVGFAGIASNGVTNRTIEPGITFYPCFPEGTDFKYAWVQVVHNYSVTQTLAFNSLVQGVSNAPPIKGNVLDNRFPYAGEGNTSDSPRWLVPDSTNRGFAGESYHVSFDFSATMWLICTPNDGGYWIPLAKVDWGVEFGATATGHGTLNNNYNSSTWTVSGGPSDADPTFVATSGASDFPWWLGVGLNAPGADNIQLETRPPGRPAIWDLA